MNRSYALSVMIITFPVIAPSCIQKGVGLEGDVSEDPNLDGVLDQLEDEGTYDINEPERELWLPCRGEPRSECWAVYTADGCTVEKPFCCSTGTADIGIPCCCEDIYCGGEFPATPCYEAPLSSIVMDCAGDSSNCPAVKPYCCRFQEVWGGQYVCADHALLNWTCDGPPEI